MTHEAGTVPPKRGPLFVLPGGTSTEPRPAPVPAGVLDRGTGTGPADGPEPGPDTAAVLVPASTVQPMTVPERAAVAVRHWSRNTALELWLHPGRLIYVLWHGRAGSMSGLRDRAISREWVPEELEGTRAGKWIAFAGIAFYVMVAPLKALAKSIDAATDKPLRAICLAALILILLFVIPL